MARMRMANGRTGNNNRNNRNTRNTRNKINNKNINNRNANIRNMNNEEEKPPVLLNKLVITNKNPSKSTKKLCKQLRRIFDPDCLTNLKEKHPRIKDCLQMADFHQISHICIVSDAMIQIGDRIKNETYTFKILDYVDNFKNYGFDYYKTPAFITFQGSHQLRPLFERFGKNEPGFKRSLHFLFDGEQIHIRHYWYKTQDTEDNFKVGLKEIGPRLTIKLIKTESGIFESMRNNDKKGDKKAESSKKDIKNVDNSSSSDSSDCNSNDSEN